MLIKLQLLHQASWLYLRDEMLSLGDPGRDICRVGSRHQTTPALIPVLFGPVQNIKIRVNRHALSSALHSTDNTGCKLQPR